VQAKNMIDLPNFNKRYEMATPTALTGLQPDLTNQAPAPYSSSCPDGRHEVAVIGPHVH
jgi:hypothetical protein